MISIKKLTKKFGNNTILDKVSLEIKDSESISIIGPSGCGKSTLLRLIIGLDNPTAGDIFVMDKNVSKLSEYELTGLRKNISMVFQGSALFDSLTVGENVAFALREHTKLSDTKIKETVKEKLCLVELDGTQNLMPSELSGGMQKRVSLARAIALDPKVILYDEPTTGLDPITSKTIENLMNKLSKTFNTTSIIVTHQLSTIFRCSQRIVMMHEGRFIESGSVEETKKSTNQIIKEFISAGLEN